MLGRLLRKQDRMTVRDIARRNWIAETKGTIKSPDKAARSAIAGSEADLRDGFNGVLTSILISIAIKLAIKYIMRWLEDELFSTDVPKEFNESK